MMKTGRTELTWKYMPWESGGLGYELAQKQSYRETLNGGKHYEVTEEERVTRI